ncbi:MAG: hypothetical protein LCH37_04000 [Bacteroidetes bacterium]|nr:hypothetical protein [Bacteroidota bacterium]
MKPKLAIFTKFCDELLPLEIHYLSGVLKREDAQLNAIFEKILREADKETRLYGFDERVDKRKYSFLKIHLSRLLEQADVDHFLTRIQYFDARVQSDNITQDDEKELMKMMASISNRHYHFMRFFELMLHFRQYLLIRIRIQPYEEVNKWIENYGNAYANSIERFKSLHQFTRHIIDEYTSQEVVTKEEENALLSIFDSEELDGLTRYAAAVRLWFLFMNKGDYPSMKQLIAKASAMIVSNGYMGRRLLVNFYANCLLLHSKTGELDKARYYGYLSLKYPTNDYLFYVVNLSSVLRRQGKSQEAMDLMKQAFPVMRTTNDLYNKMGFVAHYVHCLVDLGKLKEASRFAENYLGSHLKEVMSTRWHLFFASYFRSLVLQEKFQRLIFVVNRYKLREKELQYSRKPYYLPTMSWYIALAEFMEGLISENNAIQKMKNSAVLLVQDPLRKDRILEQLEQLFQQQPELIKKLKSELFGTS